jgi:hypothetical protein
MATNQQTTALRGHLRHDQLLTHELNLISSIRPAPQKHFVENALGKAGKMPEDAEDIRFKKYLTSRVRQSP